MRIKVGELRQLISEAYMGMLQEAEIDKKSVEIWHYPPGQTRTSAGKINREDYFIAVDLAGNQVGDGESEEDVVRSVRGKYSFIKKKKGHPIAINPAEKGKLASSPTEYIDVRTGQPVDPSSINIKKHSAGPSGKFRELPEPGKSAEQADRDKLRAQKAAQDVAQKKKTDDILARLNKDNLFNL